MEATTSVRVRRAEDSADPAVFVATRLIDLLGRARQVELDGVDQDLIRLRVGPEAGQPSDDGWTSQLFGEVRRLLQTHVFAGWECEPGR
jgi:hypothetical protein